MNEERAVVELHAPHGVVPWGLLDRHLGILERELDIAITQTGDALRLRGAAESLPVAEKLLRFMMGSHRTFDDNELKHYLRLLRRDPGFDPATLLEHSIRVSRQGKIVRARGRGQLAYINAIRENDIVFGVGPAGTGKTYLAMAWAVGSLLAGDISRIVLVRPVVEAGENLGFLPGDLTEKINPYLRPLHDALLDMIGGEEFAAFSGSGHIEVAPLAYMRGRTLNNAVIILDEAQNTTLLQMKMFLTRLGQNAKAIITGDETQSDLPRGTTSGLVHALSILGDIKGIARVRFGREDIVRHRLVQEIIDAYDRDSADRSERK